MKKITARLAVFSGFLAALAATLPAEAADLDWSGQFRFENHWVNNYGLDSDKSNVGRDATRENADGYYIPTAGQKKAQFQTLFLRLQPKLIVNDNVSIKSEWWLGNPINGFYGSDGLQQVGPSYYDANTSNGSTIRAQRFWAEAITDFGTLVIGRAPFHWGLGLVHHSGDGLWDRYQTTGDTVRLNSKFGNFTFSPATTKYRTSEVVGGTWSGGASPPGGESLTEFSIGLKYENLDEDLEAGVNMVRRMADTQTGVAWINDNFGTPNNEGSLNYTIWDIYAKKKLGKVDFAIEAPIYNGKLNGTPYKAFAIAGELNYHVNDRWDLGVKAGKVPGQPSSNSRNTDKWSMVYFNPNYKMGLIMWNYQLRNFAGVNRPAQTPNGVVSSNVSIWDNPITNANYLNVSAGLRADKWRFGAQFVMASADETAEQGRNYFNQWWRAYSDTSATKSQGKSYGKEIDLSVAMEWDEFTVIGLDWGLFMPGDFYAFSDTATDNATDSVMAIVARLGIRF